MSTITIYGEDQPRVYPLSRIYDPDVDGSTPTATGKIVPEVCSQIVDDTTGLHNQLYTVTAVDPTTYKVTMVPTSIVLTEDDAVDRILSYGNDVYMLYYATVAITDTTGTIVRLTRLVIDNKLAFFGQHGAMYELVRTKADGTQEVVSQNFDSSNLPTGTQVAVSSTAVEGVRKCNNCYSYATFTDGEQIELRLYDAAGILIATVQLITKQALILSELDDESNPIVRFEIVANQMLDGDIILYVDQNKDELAIYPQITYADGTTQILKLDGISGFLYGMEDVSTLYPGASFTLTAKYYIGDEVETNIAQGEGVRYLVAGITVRIVNTSKYRLTKISPIPVWQSDLGSYRLELFAYKENRRGYAIVTPTATVDGFSPDLFSEKQTITIQATQTPDSGIEEDVIQTMDIQLEDPTIDYPWFLIKDADQSSDDPYYNDNRDPHVAPVIYYGPLTTTDDTVVNTYYIPSDLFTQTTTQTPLEMFLENFYINANPPRIDQESAAPTPTHFTVRDPSSGIAILTQPRAVEDFADPLYLVASYDQYVGSTLVVEFWKQQDEDTFDILYGVPVMVMAQP